jgi:hypothetical protein
VRLHRSAKGILDRDTRQLKVGDVVCGNGQTVGQRGRGDHAIEQRKRRTFFLHLSWVSVWSARSLWLSNTRVTDAGVKELTRALPGLSIMRRFDTRPSSLEPPWSLRQPGVGTSNLSTRPPVAPDGQIIVARR